jgi:hypothetical protein
MAVQYPPAGWMPVRKWGQFPVLVRETALEVAQASEQAQ